MESREYKRRKLQVMRRSMGTGNKAKDFKSCHEVDLEGILSEIGSIEFKEVRRWRPADGG
jgi:hypothetical protein